ncbi:DUF6461 domain-containing protein [Actinoplanes sp. CA-131856]
MDDPAMTDLAAFVARLMPVLIERVPVPPAELLGRLAVPSEETSQPPRPRHHSEPEFLSDVRVLGPLPPERLLGALERAIGRLDWTVGVTVLAGLPTPSETRFAFVASFGADGEAVSAAVLLERLRPGLAARVASLARSLRTHPAIAPVLEADPVALDRPAPGSKGWAEEAAQSEVAIAARHGAGHIGLAVAVAGVVVEQADPPVIVPRTAAIVGLGLAAAVRLLREIPMPPSYAAALLAKIRSEYLLPRHASGSVTVADHRFGLLEGAFPGARGSVDGTASGRGDGPVRGGPPDGWLTPAAGGDEPVGAVFAPAADFSANGLAVVVDGGVVVRAGVGDGHVRVEMAVLGEEPGEVEDGWEEVVELSWRAVEGRASVVSPDGAVGGRLRGLTPPWPGDYRVRVHAVDRDSGDSEFERYKLVVWAGPPGPEVAHKRVDQLGYRLRGETVPERAARPEHAYRWVRRSRLSVAATITVVTGATVEEALRAFGADPEQPVPIDAIVRDLSLRGAIDPWVIALDAGDAVILVEDNGYRGANPGVLAAASAGGRAASMFWNVNSLTRLSFAEHGDLLASFEPWGGEEIPTAAAEALNGIDFAERGYRKEKGLAAVERFTGRGIAAADVTRMFAAGLGYRING